MRVLQAAADGRPGGGTQYVMQLAAGLMAQGDEVHLVTEQGSWLADWAQERGMATHGLPFFAGGRLNPRTWARLRRLVREIAPDLIHAHAARIGLPLTLAAQGRPLLYTVHGYHFVHKPPLLRALAIRAERRCSAAADLTVFACEHDRRLAATHAILPHGRAQRVIPSGVDLARVPQAAGGEGRVLAFLGRLVPQKDPLLLAEMMAALRNADCRLLVIGEGELRPALRARADALGVGGRIELLGGMPQAAALEALRAAQVMVLPSRWEALALVVLEAMAMGVAVVASRVGGVPEAITDGETGLLVEPGDAAGFAAAARRLLDDPALRLRLVDNARQAVRRFSWQATMAAYLELYRALARAG
jgi:glycosyltransferase involved in cell wall biosynthesis